PPRVAHLPGQLDAERSAALAGDYRPLVSLLSRVDVGTLFLELCTPRAGELDVLADLPRDVRIGVGVVNQKHEWIEATAEIAARARRAVELFGADRVLLTPDCGFATFADNPVASARIAEDKLRAIVEDAEVVRRGESPIRSAAADCVGGPEPTRSAPGACSLRPEPPTPLVRTLGRSSSRVFATDARSGSTASGSGMWRRIRPSELPHTLCGDSSPSL